MEAVFNLDDFRMTPEESAEMDREEQEYVAGKTAKFSRLMAADKKAAIPCGGMEWLPLGDIIIDGSVEFNVMRRDVDLDTSAGPKVRTKYLSRWAMPNGAELRLTRDLSCRHDDGSHWYNSSLYPRGSKWGDLDACYVREEFTFRVTSEDVTRLSGRIVEVMGDMAYQQMVVVQAAADLELAKKVADYIDAIPFDDAEQMALRAYGSHCHHCNRPLKDEISKIVGFGPSCAKSLRIPHTMEFARKVKSHRDALAY